MPARAFVIQFPDGDFEYDFTRGAAPSIGQTLRQGLAVVGYRGRRRAGRDDLRRGSRPHIAGAATHVDGSRRRLAIALG